MAGKHEKERELNFMAPKGNNKESNTDDVRYHLLSLIFFSTHERKQMQEYNRNKQLYIQYYKSCCGLKIWQK